MIAITADFRHGGQQVGAMYHRGQMVDVMFRDGKIVYLDTPAQLPQLATRIVEDLTGRWFEVGLLSAVDLVGNSAAGWTDPGHYARLHLEHSEDLRSWSLGRFLPADPPTAPGEDGTTWYWARSTIPLYWRDIVIDFDIAVARFGKAITEISLFGDLVPLPSYPYAMPEDMGQLQADLRAAGYIGAVVSYDPAPITADIRTYQPGGLGTETKILGVTRDGADVIDVRVTPVPTSASIPLPNYPYTLPGEATLLRDDLVAAGQSGAVVRLFSGTWSIHIPDRIAVLNERRFSVRFEPGDPSPSWDSDFNFIGFVQDNTALGTSGNVRAADSWQSILEADKQFVRLGIQQGNRCQL